LKLLGTQPGSSIAPRCATEFNIMQCAAQSLVYWFNLRGSFTRRAEKR